MSLGEVWWFLDGFPQSAVEGLFELLRAHGILYRHPGDDLIYILDDEGARRDVTLDFVCQEWTAPGLLAMQFWLDADTDILVTAGQDGRCATFDLDGASLVQAKALASALVLCACAVDDTRALVIDRDLPERGSEWRVAVLSETLVVPRDPDLLITVGPDGTRVIRLGRASWLRQ